MSRVLMIAESIKPIPERLRRRFCSPLSALCSLLIAFAACLAVVLAAMGWISREAMRLEREQHRAERRAALEENVRLALWRMDTALIPLIGEESARPVAAYRSFVPFSQALTPTFGVVESEGGRDQGSGIRGQLRLLSSVPCLLSPASSLFFPVSCFLVVDAPVLLPSPLLTSRPQFVLCYFQYGPNGELTSPQSPRGEANSVILKNNTLTASEVRQADDRLRQLAAFASRDLLLAALPAPAGGRNGAATLANGAVRGVGTSLNARYAILPNGLPIPDPIADRANGGEQTSQTDVSRRFGAGRGSAVGQQQLAANEYLQRARNLIRITNNTVNGDLAANVRPGAAQPDVRVAPLRPVWVGDQLLLARRVSAGGRQLVQGAWLDWARVRQSLLGAVRDLLPDADLVPVRAASGHAESRLLTTLPVRLVPGTLPANAGGERSPIRSSLAVAWICTLGAALLGAVLLAAVLSLSERRAAFASAVTHELRTPLTTFQLYTEMLDEGLVADEQQRAEYLKTLRAESNRLGHLVENVLAYARLDRSRQPIHLEQVPIHQLIDRVWNPLRERAAQAGMTLVRVESRESRVESTGPTVSVDAAAFERILANLVDNACKYAAAASNRTIELSVHPRAAQIEVRLRDFGPGAGPRERKRLFRFFSKSARDAAGSQPGVGLGLALSRALARKQGGDLSMDSRVTDGACFVLTLPRE